MAQVLGDTAVLIFARSAKRESLYKLISTNRKKNLEFWQYCNFHVEQVVLKSKLPYFISNEQTQIKGTFGNKLSASVQSIFELGYTNVIIVGNDCLALKTKHILQSYQSIANGTAAIGPDNHGGAYLIALSKKGFRIDEFEDIPWQSSNVFQSLTVFCKSEFATLEILNDVNDRMALLSAIRINNIPAEIVLLLLNILNHYTSNIYFAEIFIAKHKSFINFNKGSPANFFP